MTSAIRWIPVLLLGLAITTGCGGSSLRSALQRARATDRITLGAFTVSREPSPLGTVLAGWTDEASRDPALRAAVAEPIAVLERDLSRRQQVVPVSDVSSRPGYETCLVGDPAPHIVPEIEGRRLASEPTDAERRRARLSPDIVRCVASVAGAQQVLVVHALWGARQGPWAHVRLNVTLYTADGELVAAETRVGQVRLRTSDGFVGEQALAPAGMRPWITATTDGLHDLFAVR